MDDYAIGAVILMMSVFMAFFIYSLLVFNIINEFAILLITVAGLLSVAGIMIAILSIGDYGDKYKDKIKMLLNKSYREDVKRNEEVYTEMRILIDTIEDKEIKQALTTHFYDLLTSNNHSEAQMLHANLLAPIESSKQLRAMGTSAELESVQKLKSLIGEQVKKVLSDEYKQLDERVNDEIDMLVNLTK